MTNLQEKKHVSLFELASLFWRLGSVGFGGPIALISLMEQECSARRHWISLEAFNERYVFVKLLPGPIASQMAMWMGYHVRGRVGALVAGLSFILTPFLLILLLSIFYLNMTNLPRFTPAIQGMEAAALVVILQSVLNMFTPYKKRLYAWFLVGISATLMLFIPRWEPLIIISGGIAMLIFSMREVRTLHSVAVPILFELFWVHFKAAFSVFGTGLAVIPVLQKEIVDIYHWMSTPMFMDGIAFGQITPGPVTITSVFVGYKTAGYLGACFACLGMYLPGAILILFVVPVLFERLKNRPWIASFQMGAIPTVIGCILGATITLGRSTLVSRSVGLLFLFLWAFSFRIKLPGWLLILLGSFLNLGLSFVL